MKINKYIKADSAEDMRRHRAAAKQRRAAKSNIIDQIKASDDELQTAFDLLVPGQGKADTTAGEAVRAIMKIIYRDYNDGDVFYEGYGMETCGDAVQYLCTRTPDDLADIMYTMFDDIAMSAKTDDSYTNAINAIGERIIQYIIAHPAMVTEPNDVDMLSMLDSEDFIRDNGWEQTYELSEDLPDNVRYHLDKGDISATDIQWEIESWGCCNNADVNVSGWGDVSISDLNVDDYNELEGNLYKWLEEYGDSLDEEYGSEDDEDEDYEEEE